MLHIDIPRGDLQLIPIVQVVLNAIDMQRDWFLNIEDVRLECFIWAKRCGVDPQAALNLKKTLLSPLLTRIMEKFSVKEIRRWKRDIRVQKSLSPEDKMFLMLRNEYRHTASGASSPTRRRHITPQILMILKDRIIERRNWLHFIEETRFEIFKSATLLDIDPNVAQEALNGFLQEKFSKLVRPFSDGELRNYARTVVDVNLHEVTPAMATRALKARRRKR